MGDLGRTVRLRLSILMIHCIRHDRKIPAVGIGETEAITAVGIAKFMGRLAPICPRADLPIELIDHGSARRIVGDARQSRGMPGLLDRQNMVVARRPAQADRRTGACDLRQIPSR
mgnify:CR=1 FL=1